MKSPQHSEAIDAYYGVLSKQYHLRYVSLHDHILAPSLLKKNQCEDYLRLQAIPMEETPDTLCVATSNPKPDNQTRILLFFSKHCNKKITLVVVSRQSITEALASRFKKTYTHDMTYKRYDMDPLHSASYTFSWQEKIALMVIIVSLCFALYWQGYIVYALINLVLSMGTVVVMAFKLGLTGRLFLFPIRAALEPYQSDDALPMYTVLIPMLREKEITITTLIDSLSRMDYPVDKLDVKFLLEEDDLETQATLRNLALPWYYDVLIMPPGLPRSKPRACNYGMELAFGQFLTIYDAEDRPDSDQLRRVVNGFDRFDAQTVCIQAALNFYNYRENVLTRLFTIEYTHWFDTFVPALVFLRAPVPLGGTSNHFKIEALRDLGGWDPYIGTEDADIGVRIYRKGFKTNYVNSTTYEEANTQFKNWFRQRSRWNKGYMQTYLVNMRDPIRMIKSIGILRFIYFQLFVGGNVFSQLANLPLWIFLITGFFMHSKYGLTQHETLLFFVTWYNFLISNVMLMLSEFYATYRRGLYGVLPFVPLKIVYWFLMSFAGYFAVYELLVRPSFWYKTEHGLSKQGDDTDIPMKGPRT